MIYLIEEVNTKDLESDIKSLINKLESINTENLSEEKIKKLEKIVTGTLEDLLIVRK